MPTYTQSSHTYNYFIWHTSVYPVNYCRSGSHIPLSVLSQARISQKSICVRSMYAVSYFPQVCTSFYFVPLRFIHPVAFALVLISCYLLARTPTSIVVISCFPLGRFSNFPTHAKHKITLLLHIYIFKCA
jgi:hypothetical protein